MKSQKNCKTRHAVPSFVSIGYEKKDTNSFLDELDEAGVQILVDIRESAFSRRPDFRKAKLTELLSTRGIEYIHLRDAGNPFRLLKDGDIAECLNLYRQHFLDHPEIVDSVIVKVEDIARQYSTIAFLCYEKLSAECHRSVLFEFLTANNVAFDLKEA